MEAQLPQHAASVLDSIAGIERDSDLMLKVGQQVLSSGGDGKSAPMFPLDFLALGAIKRNLNTARAFRQMVESWNMVCARTLLRTHIDTGLRFSAAWEVQKPHDFAMAVLRGDRIDQMKDRLGQRLTDRRLVELRSGDYPWLQKVYGNLSGYIHFSGSHIIDSVASLAENSDAATMSFLLSDTDLRFPEFSWVEICECFSEATQILSKYLTGWAQTKAMTPEQLDAQRHSRD